ncbi:TetR/AcrR family transcriptional regulator [Actinotalea fermentans]|uniref:TetR/AcrR family transcriptional regulator n=1 Tax=Actinotalea fermentans TaxID=43671 RepID=UPI00051F3556|nr:TetR/AcrR family transcriptional regulator [Actinotalea fermentans]KGM15543.1 TetR family transcriptional regulator [Actinotalea fermentans ATCC 43279 = JCM 9966 = DSM 3133]
MPRPRVHDDALRARMLEVTSELVSTAGTAAVTVREVARLAGTSSSAVYALFGSRDALLAEVAEEGFRRFGAHLAAVARTADAGHDLLALGLAYRRSALADPHFYRVMFDRPRPGAPRPAERETFRTLRDAVARVLATGDADEVAYALWAQVHGLVALELAGLLPGDADERADRYTRALRAAGRAAFG